MSDTGRVRLIRKAKPTDSFFNFFSPPTPPSDPDAEEDLSESDIDELESRLELDYQIGEDIKDRVIPHAVDYFTGKALEFDEDGLDDDEFDDDEDEEFDTEVCGVVP